MLNIINLIREFAEENRNNNNSANFSWYEQRRQIYILYDNYCKKSNKLQDTKTATYTEKSNYS